MHITNCILCNREVWQGIQDSLRQPGAALLLPFAVLAAVVIVLALWPAKKTDMGARYQWPLMRASLVAGIGFGGFIDGIVFHQLLQWHEMLSAQLPPSDYVTKSVNMFWDGVFHAVTLLASITGFLSLWKAARNPSNDTSGKLLGSGLLAGWGCFNILEGLLDHHILALHNVREPGAPANNLNLYFLLFSVLLLILAWMLYPSRKRRDANVFMIL
jgi:uncharacterized membrane protein